MEEIRLVDLKGQYDKISREIDRAVLDVIRSTAYINGPEVHAFAEELQAYLSVKHVIPCANGTDALQIALMSLGLKHGDEVITPSFTYIATAEVIALLELKPVFAEVDKDTFVMTAETFEKAITAHTKAVILVHLYGQCAEMEEILKIAAANDISVIEDTAQALGAEYRFANGTVKKAGTMGTLGCTSFFPSKNLGCYGDGGAVMTDDNSLYERISMVANHGQKRKYYHDIIGVNSRLDSIQAAILRVKLRHLDEYASARQKVAEHYDNILGGLNCIETPARAENSTHVFHQYTLKLNDIDRDGMQEYLSSRGIPSNIYYPLPIHRQLGFKEIIGDDVHLPLTEELCNKVLSLPVHTEMSKDQMNFITDAIYEFSESSPCHSENHQTNEGKT